ncbi:MAG: DEAD/DEAH box helicase [Oligoflexia bacterium]|nr:DEAD/DEAH box helicase [Oligoflexia bacterium]
MSDIIQSFKDFALSPGLHQALEQMGYKHPTPIQAQAIPAALSNRDVIGSAQTGTGKTAAFCIPIIAKLEKNNKKNALILVPTREIAAQITEVVGQLTKKLPEIKLALLMGGAPMPKQIRMIQNKPRIIVATPGRLVDHLKRGTVSLFGTDILVLDEADRMLDMGFAEQLAQILRFLPSQRQTLFFSATLPPDIQKLASKYLKDPVRVSVGPVSQPVKKIQQAMIQTTNVKKNEVLNNELNARAGSILIFARTKHRTDRLARQLTEDGHQVNRIHGGRTQNQRDSAISGFRGGKFRILVATDLAARGIDIPQIAHVINYDLPQCAEDYVHRIGRTARAGAEGEALSLVTPEERGRWKEIAHMLAKAGAQGHTQTAKR